MVDHTHNFCSVTDKNFLGRWLALYESLSQFDHDFKIWTLCLDDESYEILRDKGDKVVALTLKDLNDRELENVRAKRKPNEFAWTCKPSLLLHVLGKTEDSSIVTYVDADIFFYATPLPILLKMGDWDIMLTPHRFTHDAERQEKTKGIYNAGMMAFKKGPVALECLTFWRKQCLEWCYNRYEDGKLADQMYLNAWPEKYGRAVDAPEGVNVGPWNIEKQGSRPLICYHFHGLKTYLDGKGRVKPYPVTVFEKKIYGSYVKALQRAYDTINMIRPGWNYGFDRKLDILRRTKQTMQRYLS